MNNTQNLRGIATISFFADDHVAAQQWYTDFLGMEPYFVRPGYTEFRIGDYQQELGIIDRKYVQELGLAENFGGAILYWHVNDLDTTFNDLLVRGATQLEAPTKRGEGFVTASVIDPFGNILGIMQNVHYLEILSNLKQS